MSKLKNLSLNLKDFLPDLSNDLIFEHLNGDCLVGNLEGKDFTDLIEAISELVDLPEPIEYGLAKV